MSGGRGKRKLAGHFGKILENGGGNVWDSIGKIQLERNRNIL